MRISDWSSDVCSSDLLPGRLAVGIPRLLRAQVVVGQELAAVGGARRQSAAGSVEWSGLFRGCRRRVVHLGMVHGRMVHSGHQPASALFAHSTESEYESPALM